MYIIFKRCHIKKEKNSDSDDDTQFPTKCVSLQPVYIRVIIMNSTRQNKIAALLQKELANIFIADGRNLYNCMITVTKTTITSDLSIARAYLSVYMAPDKEAIVAAIRANTKDIRFRLGQRIRNQLRVVPQLEFFLDDTLDYIEHIDELLKK